MKKNIIVIGGGTGGHLFPAIGFCDILKKEGYNVHLLTDKRCANYLPEKLDYDYEILDIDPLNKSLTGFIKFFLSLVFSSIEVKKLFAKFKPDLIITCGGYSSLPAIFVGLSLKIKIIIHEQNAYVGRVNYLASKFCSKFFTSFSETTNLPNIEKSKIVNVGNPVGLKFNIENQRVKNKIFTILVTAGSQGADFFDDNIHLAMLELKNKVNLDFKVIHHVKNQKIEKVKRFYEKNLIKAEVSSFFKDIEKIYLETDFLIGRAGASTIFEIINYQIPSILIPFPHAKDNHQYFNAKNLSDKNASILLSQKEAKISVIVSKLFDIISDMSYLEHMKTSLVKMRVNTSKIMLDEISKIFENVKIKE